jgi:hypothetical protein
MKPSGKKQDALLTPERVEHDVSMMVGGLFLSDHVGPSVIEEVLARFETAPLEYLRETEAQADRASEAQLVRTHYVSVIARVAKTHSAEAQTLARKLIQRYSAARTRALTKPSWPSEVSWIDGMIAALNQVL